MRIELEIEDDLTRKARELTGLSEPAAPVAFALRQLAQRESALRLASPVGTAAGGSAAETLNGEA